MTHDRQPSGGPSRILILEDDQNAAGTISNLLSLHGHEASVARDAAQALEIARVLHPDHVLLDLSRLGMCELDVVQRLRRLAGSPFTLIAIADRLRDDDRPGAPLPGFDHQFHKPIVAGELDRLLAVLGPGARPSSASVTGVDPASPTGQADRAANPLEAPSLSAPPPGNRAMWRDVEIVNEYGLNLRAADRIVRTARRFRARSFVGCEDRLASANSILDLTILMAERGARLSLEAEGPDAEAAVDALRHLVESGFEEPAPSIDHV